MRPVLPGCGRFVVAGVGSHGGGPVVLAAVAAGLWWFPASGLDSGARGSVLYTPPGPPARPRAPLLRRTDVGRSVSLSGRPAFSPALKRAVRVRFRAGRRS
ncbi:hypothetical protein Ppa06_56390 [Planomonospora parontospora subsp. parontospora]|uniref:Uncharacterized protein n=2 Tax=Planomonospora parontospora TaxID=58119 RepID=A0AA37BK27_9ACTN|nr:hypothetical protein GCM10010126_45140 [Planomonospora parontospora]GII11841.1 hypothetical protein Ppa06_56390 [Planomonospora parontospora subsp. parontospora]